MTFDRFIASLAYSFVTDEQFQRIFAASGLSWLRLPKHGATEVALEYTQARATGNSHETALHKIKGGVDYLWSHEPDFTGIPYDPVILAELCAEQLKAHEYAQLAKALAAKPEDGDKLVASFRLKVSKAVEARSADQVITDAMIEHDKRVKDGEAVTEIPGFEMLSKAIGGFNRQRIILITGESGYGKTNLGLNIAIRGAEKLNVAYVNMEMSFQDMGRRLAVIGTGTSYADLYAGKYDLGEMLTHATVFKDRFFMTSGRSLSLDMIEAWLRLLVSERDIGLVLIDYDQKLDLHLDKNTPEWKAVQDAMLALEELAKELNFCVIVYAQVNREGEIASSHRAIYGMHTHLDFKRDENHGPIILAKKNRHGMKDACVQVEYDEKNSQIREFKLITYEEKKPARKTLR